MAAHAGQQDLVGLFDQPLGKRQVRELSLGLRETAAKVSISPTYLSRIERGMEGPPRPDVIKALAKVLAADPDVLFRLSSATDPDVVDYLHEQPEALNLLRYIKDEGFSKAQIKELKRAAERIRNRDC